MAVSGVCPSCGGRDLRISQPKRFGERVLEWIGIYQVRCRHCRARFQRSVWNPKAVIYARCPKCYRMELSTWSEQYYNPSFGTVAALRLGATPYRCEFCRCNFASWRACKERFLWRNHRKPGAVSHTEADAARANDKAGHPADSLHG